MTVQLCGCYNNYRSGCIQRKGLVGPDCAVDIDCKTNTIIMSLACTLKTDYEIRQSSKTGPTVEPK